jgi:hypothetical protein
MCICAVVIRSKLSDISHHPAGIGAKKNVDMRKAAEAHKKPPQQTVQTEKK